MVNPVWEERDALVLNAALQICEENDGFAEPAQIMATTGFDEETVERAIRALEHEKPSLFGKVTRTYGGCIAVQDPTGEARRRIGWWPTPDTVADQFATAIAAAAEREQDPEKRGKLRELGSWAGTTGKDVVAKVIAEIAVRSMGG